MLEKNKVGEITQSLKLDIFIHICYPYYKKIKIPKNQEIRRRKCP